MSTAAHHTGSNGDAVFIGWLRSDSGKAILPFYNIILECHPSYGSTVSDTDLRRMNLRVPEIPEEDQADAECEEE